MTDQQEWIGKVNDLERQVSDLGNLIAALQILCWDLCATPIQSGSELDRLRNAIVGVGNALEERVARA